MGDATLPSQPSDSVEGAWYGRAGIFATSAGAINALALVAAHPQQVRTLAVHEPPAAALLPDRDFALAATRDIHDTYLGSGFGPAMAVGDDDVEDIQPPVAQPG